MLYNIWVSDKDPGHKDNLVWLKDAEKAIYWFEEADELMFNDFIVLWTDDKTNCFVNWFINWNTYFGYGYELRTAQSIDRRTGSPRGENI